MLNDLSPKPRLLIFLQWFTPAHKAGGPIRSIQNLIELIHEDYDIYVFASDRDLGDHKPFATIQLNKWLKPDLKFSIIYNDPNHQSRSHLRNAVEIVRPDFVYFNSMYSFRYFLLPLIELLLMRFNGKMVLAPRGMLKATAIKFKSNKKNVFLFLLRKSGLLKRLYFQATDEQEFRDIQSNLNVKPERILIVNNPPPIVNHLEIIEKEKNFLKLIFVGRIHPIKGLDFLIDVLMSIKDKVEVNVVGWIENLTFYSECLEKIRKLPGNIKVTIVGDLPFPEVQQQLQKAHFLILPTHGENFGNAIFEALTSGKPVIISDETPWRNLEKKKIGWDISLKNPDQFSAAIQYACKMEQEEYNQWCSQAYQFAKHYVQESNIKAKYLNLFGQ